MNITQELSITKNIFSEKVSDLIYIDIGHMSVNFSDCIRIEGNCARCKKEGNNCFKV